MLWQDCLSLLLEDLIVAFIILLIQNIIIPRFEEDIRPYALRPHPVKQSHPEGNANEPTVKDEIDKVEDRCDRVPPADIETIPGERKEKEPEKDGASESKTEDPQDKKSGAATEDNDAGEKKDKVGNNETPNGVDLKDSEDQASIENITDEAKKAEPGNDAVLNAVNLRAGSAETEDINDGDENIGRPPLPDDWMPGIISHMAVGESKQKLDEAVTEVPGSDSDCELDVDTTSPAVSTMTRRPANFRIQGLSEKVSNGGGASGELEDNKIPDPAPLEENAGVIGGTGHVTPESTGVSTSKRAPIAPLVVNDQDIEADRQETLGWEWDFDDKPDLPEKLIDSVQGPNQTGIQTIDKATGQDKDYSKYFDRLSVAVGETPTEADTELRASRPFTVQEIRTALNDFADLSLKEKSSVTAELKRFKQKLVDTGNVEDRSAILHATDWQSRLKLGSIPGMTAMFVAAREWIPAASDSLLSDAEVIPSSVQIPGHRSETAMTQQNEANAEPVDKKIRDESVKIGGVVDNDVVRKIEVEPAALSTKPDIHPVSKNPAQVQPPLPETPLKRRLFSEGSSRIPESPPDPEAPFIETTRGGRSTTYQDQRHGMFSNKYDALRSPSPSRPSSYRNMDVEVNTDEEEEEEEEEEFR